MAKEQKEIKITFDIINNQVKNAKYTGKREDLTAVLCWGGQDFFDAAINAMLRFYLECSNREQFLAKFLATVAEYDNTILSRMAKPNEMN